MSMINNGDPSKEKKKRRFLAFRKNFHRLFSISIMFFNLFPWNIYAKEPSTSFSGVKRNDNARKVLISINGSLQNPAFSPDGNSLVLTRFRGGYNKGPADLIVYYLSVKRIKIIVSDNSDNINLPGSAWNAATRQIVFSSSRKPHDEIFVIDENGKNGDEIKITNRKNLVAYEPSFSPDGQWIVFESHRLGIEDNGIITKYRTDGTEPYQILTRLTDDCRQPNWSPDNGLVVYQKLDKEQWDLWVMNIDGKNKKQITSGEGDKTDASFSPDGQCIVYSADSPTLKCANLFIKPVSGGEPIRITHFDGYDGAPSWSPDGSKIIFESSHGDPDNTLGTTIWMINISVGNKLTTSK
jgi:TolB protein